MKKLLDPRVLKALALIVSGICGMAALFIAEPTLHSALVALAAGVPAWLAESPLAKADK